MKKIIKKILGEKGFGFLIKIRNFFVDCYYVKSYSQDGEDVVLKGFFLVDKVKKGFYVDIGAHHPKRFSNTFMFYKNGWKGINVDALPGSKKVFNKNRKKDINLELGISRREEYLNYYIFNEPALNGFSKELSHFRDNKSRYNLIGTKKIKTYPLSYILDKHLPKDQKIDFMSIDVEGLDLEVLESNNWKKYKPNYLLVEITVNNLEDIIKNETYIYLKGLGYSLVAKTVRTCIFKRNSNG
jgi:FkbM family methyltransferase